MTIWMGLTASLAALAIAFALWRHRSRADTRLRLYEMMRLRGVPAPKRRNPDALAAERRCAACGSKVLCDELLRAADGADYRQFCPNALYVEWLRSTSLHFD